MKLHLCDKRYIGSTWNELNIRLQQHITNKKSQIFKYRKYKPKLNLSLMLQARTKKLLKK